MLNRSTSKLVFILCLFLFNGSLFGKTLTYEELPKLVLEKNENVQAARLTAQASEKRTGRLFRSFLPQLSAQIGSEEFKVGSAKSDQQDYWNVEASINLYRGGRDKIENDIKVSLLEMNKSDYTIEYQTELKEAKQAYWRYIGIRQTIDDKKQGLEKTEVQIKSARKRAGAGVSTAADTVQFELQKITLNQDLRKLQLEQDLMLNKLSVAIGFDEHESLVIKGDFPALPLKNFEAESLQIEKQIYVKSLKAKEKAEYLKAKQSGRWWHPKVDLYSSYGLPSLSEEYSSAIRKDNEWKAGVRLTLDLGQGFDDQNESTARALDAKASALRAAHASREIVAQDHELRHDLTLLSELIKESDENLQSSERFLKLTQSEFSRGVKNGPDLIEAFNTYYGYREKRTKLYQEYYLNKIELESLLAAEEKL